MKKALSILLALCLCFALFAACGKTDTPAEPASNDDGQNPVMNIIGNYMNDRVSATIEAVGTNGAKVTAYWGDTARDGFRWELTGTFDDATNRINYTDAKKTSVTYTDVDVFEVNEVLFENGKGYIQVNDDYSLTWNDEQDPDMAFEPLEFVPAETEDDTTAPADASEPVRSLADFAGEYQSGRCGISIIDKGNNEATIEVHWGSSATEATDWRMSGSFDADTMRINYTDAVKTNSVFAEDGTQTEAKEEYNDGYGRIQFYGDGTLAWQDEKEADQLAGMVFELISSGKDESEGARTLADYVGDYQSDRCTISVTDEGNNTAKIKVHWGSSAFESAEWEMTGDFDADTMRIRYTDAVKTIVVFDENGTQTEAKEEYNDGYGRLQFHTDGTMSWQDEKEADQLVGMVFEKLG